MSDTPFHDGYYLRGEGSGNYPAKGKPTIKTHPLLNNPTIQRVIRNVVEFRPIFKRLGFSINGEYSKPWVGCIGCNPFPAPPHLKAIKYSGGLKAYSCCKVHGAEGFSLVFNQYIRASISTLTRRVIPLAIAWLIVSIVVNSVYGQVSTRLSSHVTQEAQEARYSVFSIDPSIANGNTSTPVIGERVTFFIVTSVHNGVPCSIFDCSCFSPGFTMSCASFYCHFYREASTAFSCPPAKRTNIYTALLAAGAFTLPQKPFSGFTIHANSRKSSKHLPGKINKSMSSNFV